MKKMLRKCHVMFCTLCILCTSYMAVFPESHAKYVNVKEDVLKFNTAFYKMDVRDLLIEWLDDRSSLTKAVFQVQFGRNSKFVNEINTDNKDVYTIEMPRSCSIKSSETRDGTAKVDATKKTITFTSNIETNSALVIECKVDSTILDSKNDILKLDVKMNEKIGDENSFPYLKVSTEVKGYTKKFLTEVKPDSEKHYLSLTTDRLIFEYDKSKNADYYNGLVKSWIYKDNKSQAYKDNKESYDAYYKKYEEKYAGIDNIKLIMKSYFESYYASNNVLNETIDDSGLKGLTVSKVEVDDKTYYQYSIDKNYLGYARTDFGRGGINTTLYFSTEDETELNEAMNYYLEKYIYSDELDKDKRELVSNYIANMGGLKFDENGKIKKIPGLGYRLPTNEFVSIDDNILDFIKNKAYIDDETHNNVLFQISYNIKTYMESSYQESFGFISNDVISMDLKNSIRENEEIKELIKNNKGDEEFNYFYPIYDEVNKHYIMIRVYSNLGDSYNYVTFDVINYEDEIALKYKQGENGEDTNEISEVIISWGDKNTEEEAKAIKQALIDYFTTNLSPDVNIPEPTKKEIISNVPTDDVSDSEPNEPSLGDDSQDEEKPENDKTDVNEADNVEDSEDSTDNGVLANAIPKKEEADAETAESDEDDKKETETEKEEVSIDVNSLKDTSKEVELLQLDKAIKPKDKDEVEEEDEAIE